VHLSSSCNIPAQKEYEVFVEEFLHSDGQHHNSNKSVELLNGLAALVLLDVCQKIKVSYLTVGHTHNDDDGAIGVAGNHMCAANIESLSRCDALLMESFEDIQSTNTFVEEIVGITDYGKILCDRSSKNPFSINGMIYCY
jgi:hypothetical protein